MAATPDALHTIARLFPIRVSDFHGPAIGDWLRLAGVVRQCFEIVLEQVLSLQCQLRVGVGSGDGNCESQRELN